MTPAETLATLDAESWRAEQRQRLDTILAWQVAALTRSKRFPTLKQLLSIKPARPLAGEELERRRAEFSDMTKNIDLSNIRRANADSTG